MTDTAFTTRNVMKFVVKSIVAHKSSELVAKTISDYTEYEKDALGVRIGSGVIGWGISDKLSPVTDKIVDKTADFITEQRGKRSIKKSIKEVEKD